MLIQISSLSEKIRNMANSQWDRLHNTVNFGLLGVGLLSLWTLPLPYNWVCWALLLGVHHIALSTLSQMRYPEIYK